MKILIIGAGIGGLTAAYRLQQLGHEVEILEASNRAGGRMRTLEYKGDKVDVGAQFMHTGYVATLKLIDELGLTGSIHDFDSDMLFHLEDGSVYRFNQNKPYIPMLGVLGNLKILWLLLKYVVFGKKFSMYKIDRDIPEYDNRKATDLIKGIYQKELNDYFLEPLLLGPPDGTSLYQAVRWVRCSIKEGLFALTGGMSQLVDAIAEHVSIRYQTPVKSLVMDQGKVVGVQLEKDGEIIKADHIVLAAEPPAAAKILPDELAEQRDFYQQVVPTRRPMPVFFLDSSLSNSDFSGVFGHVNKPSRRHNVMYIFDHTEKTPEMVPSGKSILAAWLGVKARDELFDKSDEEVLQKSIIEMEQMIPGFSNRIEHTEVVRYPYVETEFEAGAHARVLRFLEHSRDLKSISFVGGVFGGCFIEAAVQSAETAVEKIGS